MSQLIFDETKGIGYMPFTSPPIYDDAYFEKYVPMGESTFGVALNALRAGLVLRYVPRGNELLDVGIGDGAFIRARGAWTLGYDVNPKAKRMLERRDAWCDPLGAGKSVWNATFWDSLEHMENPETLINMVKDHCFVSIPVFLDKDHILRSKHFRPNEHYWYFTRAGIIKWFWDLGFDCLEMNDMETKLGREDIGTFVFKRQ